MKKYWKGIFGQVLATMKRFTRDKMALFFTFLFPLLFLFVFGSIFNNPSVNFNVVIVDNAKNDFSKGFIEGAKQDKGGALKVKEITTMDKAKEKLKHSQIEGIIELPKGFGEATGEGDSAKPRGTLNVLYSKGSEQAGSTLSAIMGQVIDEINKHMGQPEAPFKVASKAIGDERLSTFDYTFTGLLAFSLMSMGVFGLANQMPTEKQKGSYRRLRAAPFTAGQLIIATAITYTIISIISAAMMIIVGMLAFKFQMRGNWLLLVPFLTICAAMMTGIGLAIGAWAKNENQSSPLSNLISFPMMFLSGAFFPAYLFPEWLQGVSKFIPMAPVVDGFRLIMAEKAGLIEILPQVGGVLLAIIIVYALAIKLFRWE
ncbi:ABC transporter permease [Candidatus Saccharibacteria bacterium oral taxon 955]|nr:ABC transporter permease [Candidatus Saccharibacteria bacterium oral taxon 955]